MQLRVIALSTLAAAVLTACGGGGSLSGSSAGGGQLDTGSTAYTYVDVDKSPLFNDQAAEWIKAQADDETLAPTLLTFKSSAPLAQTGVTFNTPNSGNLAADQLASTGLIPVSAETPLYGDSPNQVQFTYVPNWQKRSETKTFTIDLTLTPKSDEVTVVPGHKWGYLDGKDYGGLKGLGYDASDSSNNQVGWFIVGEGNSEVRFGDFYTNQVVSGRVIGGLFLLGGLRSSGLPIEGKATYTGHMRATASASLEKNDGNGTGWGMAHGDSDSSTVTLTADFANQTVTGSFEWKQNDNHFAGKLSMENGKILGNAVVGTATGQWLAKSSGGSVDLAGGDKDTPQSSAAVNAAFYGDHAEVIAGTLTQKASADGYDLAAVFGASTEGTKDLTINKRFQAGVLLAQKTEAKPATETTSEAAAGNSDNASGNSATASTSTTDSSSTTEESGNWVTGKYDPYQEVNFTGSTKSLEVGGMVIQVKPTKGKYGYKSTNMSFGVWPQTKDLKSDEMSDAEKKQAEINAAKNEELAKKGLGGLFVQGFLTPEANMPKTGKANYNGTWEFFASDEKGTYNSYASKADLQLTVDFAAKTVSGTFYDREDTPALTLTGGKIDGVTWTASNQTISLGNTNTDQDYGDTRQIFTVNDISIHGWFYGPHAQETGGYIYSDSTKAAGVFGAKQCEDNACSKTDAATAGTSGQ